MLLLHAVNSEEYNYELNNVYSKKLAIFGIFHDVIAKDIIIQLQNMPKGEIFS